MYVLFPTLPGVSFAALRASRRLLNLPRRSNPRSGLKSQNLPRAKLARFSGFSSAAGAPGPRRGAGGLVVLRPSLKRGVPGSVPPWRAPCFSWPCRGFGLPGVFFRGAAMVFYFQPLELVAEPLGCCQSRFSLGSSFQLGLRLLPSRDAQLRPTTRSRNTSSGGARSSSISKSLGLSALCAVETAPFAARQLVLLKKRACRRFNFPPLLFLSNFIAKLCFRGIFLCQSQSRARLLLLASFCWSPHAVALALLGFRRAPQIRFSFLRRAGDLLRLALGSGIWVGGIEIEALDDLCFEKSTSRSL